MRAALALLVLLAACDAAQAPLRVSGAWLRSLPDGARSTAAYMTIENPGRTRREIASAGSPQFARAELHETRIEGGMARMRPLPVLGLAPGARVTLAPGGLHLMLSDPLRPLAPGERVRLILKLADGSALEVEAEVRAP
jgi:hypothetical protein